MDLILSKHSFQYSYFGTIFLWLAMLTGLIVYRKQTALGFLFVSVVIFWIFTTPVVSSYMVACLEQQYLPVPVNESPQADAIVALGGSVAIPNRPRIEVELTDTSDRILHAVRLYKAGKAPLVIATGGASNSTPEAYVMKALLKEWGVPEKRIVIEAKSLNTYQNAVNTKQLIDKRGVKCVLLVTSAIHMPRALPTFRTLGINAVPSPTDYKNTYRKNYEIVDFLPDIHTIGKTSMVIKEVLGMMVYRWRGWVEDRKQKAEDPSTISRSYGTSRCQRAEGKKVRRLEDRSQKTEDRRQRSESKGRRAKSLEDRQQCSESRGPQCNRLRPDEIARRDFIGQALHGAGRGQGTAGRG